MAACSGGERDDGASCLRRTNRGSRTAGGPASPAGATRRQSAGAPSAPAVPPDALVGRARGVAAGSPAAKRSPASPATPGGRGRTVRSRSPGPRTRRPPATASPDRTTATRSTGTGAGALSLRHCTRSPLHAPHVPVRQNFVLTSLSELVEPLFRSRGRSASSTVRPSPPSGLLADHVEERLALLVADDLEGAGEGVGQGRGGGGGPRRRRGGRNPPGFGLGSFSSTRIFFPPPRSPTFSHTRGTGGGLSFSPSPAPPAPPSGARRCPGCRCSFRPRAAPP